MFGDDFFVKNPEKEKVVNEMIDFYSNHKDKPIYKKTDYLCNLDEKICICNTQADEFRRLYDGINYEPNNTYVSWITKK